MGWDKTEESGVLTTKSLEIRSSESIQVLRGFKPGSESNGGNLLGTRVSASPAVRDGPHVQVRSSSTGDGRQWGSSALPHRGQWEWKWQWRRRHRAEGKGRCGLGRLGSVMPGTVGPRSAGCRSPRREKLGPSMLPRFAGCSQSPAPTQSPGTLELLWGFPRRTRNGCSSLPGRHLHHTTQAAGGRPWSSCARRRGRWAQLQYTYRGKWCDFGVVMSRRRRQQPSVSKSCCPPSSTSGCAAAKVASWRERGRVLAAEMPMTLRGLPKLRLTKPSGAILQNRGALMFPAGTFEEWPR